MNKIILSEQEKNIIAKLGDKVYTVDYITEWVNREDNVFSNAPAALQAMGATGYYRAVQRVAAICDDKGAFYVGD